jgi:formylglycine-generating enzyme required for sulfatase activity
MRNPLLACALAAVATPLLLAQSTGRTMQFLAPAVLGQTASFGVSYPGSAAGNLYLFLWCMPPFAGTMPLTVPGFTVQGCLRVDPANSVSAFAGVFGAGGSVAHALAIPNHPSFVGVSWDLQSIDLAVGAGVLSLADNDLAVVLADGPLASLNMVTIAPGTFQMGSNAATGAPYFSQAWERPVHPVTISRPFCIGKYEVTQAEYQAVMGTNPSYYQGANRPVETVSWHDAMAYCAALTVREAAAGRLPAGYQYRLPTEAEWEYCCRAGTTTEFHYGPSLVCGQASFGYSYHTNSSCNSPGTVPVGGYAPNAWGLHDMHGNVWEWCLDGWDGSANYPSAAVIDPYVSSGPNRVSRGGSWFSDSCNCRSAYRYRYVPTNRYIGIGFRVVLAPALVP